MKFDVANYAFDLPKDLVANRPATPRDAARLFIYDTKTDTVTFSFFREIADYLEPYSLVVFNDTKVVPARVVAKKETGGVVELLLFVDEYREGDAFIRGYADRKLSIGETVRLQQQQILTVVGQEEYIFHLKPQFSMKALFRYLERYGMTPLPKYIKKVALSEKQLRARYQTIFAKSPSSIAAPTASLHFTEAVIDSLKTHSIEKTFLTLSVGRGTFAPVTKENFMTGKLHAESYSISSVSAEHVRRARLVKNPVVAVGTTVVRCLESAASHILKPSRKDIAGSAEIFIHPPYQFQICDALITNFHIPGSSLVMLVDAFLQSKKAKRSIIDLYHVAIKERFRFYSFGDAMLIL